jgi:CoA:oxalate CoA-transferase
MSSGRNVPSSAVLKDLTVIDCCWLLPGQFAAMILADLGARVIKIELPGGGDYVRAMRPAGFATVNRGKESLTLDLRIPEAQEVLHRLVRQADVVLEGFRPGVMARFNSDYGTLSRIKPSIVYCSLSGFGQDGPFRDHPGHGLNYAAIAGLQHLAGDSTSLTSMVSDLAGSLFATIAVLVALRERDRSGSGQYIDLSITDAVYGLLTEPLAARSKYADGDSPKHHGAAGVFRTLDDRLITVGAVEDQFFRKLTGAINRSEWLHDERFSTLRARQNNAAELQAALKETLFTRTSAEWIALFESAGVPCTLVNDLREATEDPYAQARGLVTLLDQVDIGRIAQIRFPAVYSTIDYSRGLPAPTVGEHTASILEALGYNRAEIADLKGRSAV